MKKPILFALLAAVLALPAADARASNRKIDAKFNNADVNDDNVLNELEFFATQTKKLSAAFARFRFQNADVNDDGFVDLTEFRASRGGISGGKPTKIEIFVLSDQDDDGTLDVLEYADTQRQSMPWASVLKGFGKRDRDDNSELTPREFGIRRFAR
jgi:hypothetical protein